jgi:tRNA(Ile2)-agmatinylcytidine synthase
MRCLVGLDDTDSSRGYCTTYLAYRIATDIRPDVEVLPYPRLVRLNPNIPFKTRGNAAVCLVAEVKEPDLAFELIKSKVTELADVEGGANAGMVFLEDPRSADLFEPLYHEALTGLVSPHRVRAMLRANAVRTFELGNGMGIVGAASSLGFDERFDHTYELISYRRAGNWGTRRLIDSSSVTKMDAATFPHTFNNYDYQKRKVLIAPHGPDPVFAGIRGESPSVVLRAFQMVEHEEQLEGYMIYASNQHTEAHLQKKLEWKVFSSGWIEGKVESVEVGPGGHAYFTLQSGGRTRPVAAYEPTGDLRRVARLLRPGDRVRAYGGVRRPSTRHPSILNLEKLDILRLAGRGRPLVKGTYIASPRANRHLTKPLIRHGREVFGAAPPIEGWLRTARSERALARSR